MLRGRRVELLPGCSFDVRGGAGGVAGGFGIGGDGGRGRLRFEDFDGLVDLGAARLRPPVSGDEEDGVIGSYKLARGSGVSFARSRFFVPRILDPDYAFSATDPMTGKLIDEGADLTVASPLPDGVEIFVRFEGAPAKELDPSTPDLAQATGFVTDIDSLDGADFLRFEVEFRLPAGVDPNVDRIAVDSIRIRYRGR